ncbi:cation/multidrug efflux pump [Gilvimarinus sp. DA14]|uniref:cation/multidrug efflux pump n=1 Tax=Gilvimarinus sp. DA14 TaxID=2956798 RepID=UPI0020B66ACB|nr:cation/multidrug efflux pump [Gilvimarinus sp. DA14]UTF61946.1 cation/multidrug efflux pump [Gilvimarinus sp. DA14]
MYSAIAALAALLGLLVAYSAAKLLWKDSWVLGWLRGMFGLALLALAVVFVFIAMDIFSYRQIQSEHNVATLSFDKKADQVFNVLVVDAQGVEHNYIIKGDQWQLDARIIKWTGALANVGIKPGYRLDRLSGRYYSLEKEREEERTVYSFNESPAGIDVWAWLREVKEQLPIVDAVYGSATYLPMADDAVFEISLSVAGLVARPLNEEARAAVGDWQ